MRYFSSWHALCFIVTHTQSGCPQTPFHHDVVVSVAKRYYRNEIHNSIISVPNLHLCSQLVEAPWCILLVPNLCLGFERFELGWFELGRSAVSLPLRSSSAGRRPLVWPIDGSRNVMEK